MSVSCASKTCVAAVSGVGIGNAHTPCLARYEVPRAGNLGEYGPVYLEHGWRTAELMRIAREHGVDPRASRSS